MCQPMLVVVRGGVLGMNKVGWLVESMVPKTLLHEFGDGRLAQLLP